MTTNVFGSVRYQISLTYGGPRVPLNPPSGGRGEMKAWVRAAPVAGHLSVNSHEGST